MGRYDDSEDRGSSVDALRIFGPEYDMREDERYTKVIELANSKRSILTQRGVRHMLILVWPVPAIHHALRNGRQMGRGTGRSSRGNINMVQYLISARTFSTLCTLLVPSSATPNTNHIFVNFIYNLSVNQEITTDKGTTILKSFSQRIALTRRRGCSSPRVTKPILSARHTSTTSPRSSRRLSATSDKPRSVSTRRCRCRRKCSKYASLLWTRTISCNVLAVLLPIRTQSRKFCTTET